MTSFKEFFKMFTEMYELKKIQEAKGDLDLDDLKTGAFTKWCKDNGYGDVNCKCICAGLKAGGVIAKRANFANVFGKHDCECS
jgi:hypothetical protein